MVALGLQQQRVHVGMTGYAGSLGLHGLRPTYLQAVGRGIRVECPVLRLEGCRVVAILQKDATECRCQHALADIAACTSQHQGV